MTRLCVFIAIVLIALTSIGCSRVAPGEVGVKVYLIGGSKGVDHEVLTTGRHYIGFNEELHIFPTFQQNYVWTKDSTQGSPTDESFDFQTRDGMSINADVAIQFRIEEQYVAKVFQTYRKGIDELTDVVLRKMVSDAFTRYASKYDAEEAYSTCKNALMDSVNAYVKREAAINGVTVENVSYIGAMRLPPQVTSALNAKIQAVQDAQRKENELRSARAEAEKTVATAEGTAKSILLEAEAQAKANKILAASITNELVNYEKIKKWDGKLPQVSGGASTMIDLR